MGQQLNTTTDGQLACAFGEPWLGPHYLCQALTGKPAHLPDYSSYAPKRLTAGTSELSDVKQGTLF